MIIVSEDRLRIAKVNGNVSFVVDDIFVDDGISKGVLYVNGTPFTVMPLDKISELYTVVFNNIDSENGNSILYFKDGETSKTWFELDFGDSDYFSFMCDIKCKMEIYEDNVPKDFENELKRARTLSKSGENKIRRKSGDEYALSSAFSF